jgi:hypothetical protein
MASRLLRRSGVAVGLVVEQLGWRADYVYQVGVGQEHQEVDVLLAEWPGVKFVGCDPMDCKDYPGEFHCVAVSDRPGSATLYVRKHHKDGSSFYPAEGIACDKRLVPANTLDGLFPKPQGNHILLWLDCEGVELRVLQGAESFCCCVEVVNVEITANPVNEEWCSPASVHHWLTEHGFVRQWIHTQRISSGQFDAIYVRPHLFKRRFCCDPWSCQ